MENSEVEVDDAVATIIANVEFGEFAPEVVEENFVVARIQEATTEEAEDKAENSSYSEETLSCPIQYDGAGSEVHSAGSTPSQKKQCMPRKKRTAEDGNYPDIKSWKPFINTLIDDGVRGYHKTPIPDYQGSWPKVEDFLKPDFILWDLHKEFPEINGNKCPIENCNEPLALYPMAHTYMMRILYDFEKPILLVTSMLRCKNAKEHRFLGYDPRIMMQLSDPDSVPFVLFHKVGMTRELFNSIMNQVSNGVKFGQIQDMLRKNYIHSHNEREKAYLDAIAQYLKDHPEESKKPDMFPKIKIKGPRNTFIGQCFLLGFKEKEYFYKLSMSQLLADEWIGLDELKLPTNVGTNSRGVWKKEMEHLFYCQNEVGQVLTWQLTGANSFEEIRDTLVSIRDRHEQVGKLIRGCSTAFCCEWRELLGSVFGPDFQVKNDIERSIGKLSEKMQEESLMFLPCIDEFRLVFQDPVDSNKIRILPTPSPGVILNNLEVFKEKWKKVKEENGKLVLTNSALRVIEDLEPHIVDGCFSGIPPFPSCIDRKAFQMSLRKKVNNCRLGIPVMVAIASIALHGHNTLRQEELGRDTAPVLLVVPDDDKSANEEVPSTVSLGNSNLQCLTVEVNMNKALESIASSQAKAIKSSEHVDCKTLLQSVNEYFDNCMKDSKDHDYQLRDQCLDETIIKKTITYLKYAETLSKVAPGIFVNEKLIPFLTCAFPLLLQDRTAKEECMKIEQVVTQDISPLRELNHLEPILHETISGCMVTNPEDSFLNAIAVIVNCYLSALPNGKDNDDELSIFQDSLKGLKFEKGMKVGDIVRILKQLLKGKDVVNRSEDEEESSSKTEDSNTEKKDNNRRSQNEEKSQDISDTDKKEKDESKAFSDAGKFEMMVRETANILSTQFSLFSAMKNFPIVPIFPQKVIWSPTLFLFYDKGRFVPVLPKDLLGNVSNDAKEVSLHENKPSKEIANVRCKCGRGHSGNTGGKCYTDKNSKYITRCMCFRLQQPCTKKCECRNCKNPFGDRPPKRPLPVKSVDVDDGATNQEIGTVSAAKRRRHVHHHSFLSKDLGKENFQTGAGIEVSLGKWSLAEKYLFESLISEMKTEEDSLTTELVAQKFNNVVQVASAIEGFMNLVGFKTPTQVNERLKERERDVEEYLLMYQTQLDFLISRNEAVADIVEEQNAATEDQKLVPE